MTDKKKWQWLFVSFSDGRTYKIPAKIIAEHRASYYASKEPHQGLAKEIFDDEVDFALTDSYELEDWATNNVNWPDVKEHAELIREKQVNYFKEWVNAEKWTE